MRILYSKEKLLCKSNFLTQHFLDSTKRQYSDCVSSHKTEKPTLLSSLDFTRASILTFFYMESKSTHKHISKTTSKLLFSRRNSWWKPLHTSAWSRICLKIKWHFHIFIYCLEYFILDSFGTSLNANNSLSSIVVLVTYRVFI